MDNEIIDEELTNQVNERPTYLTVLCILTFIGSGFGILGSLATLGGGAAMSRFGGTNDTMLLSVMGLAAGALCLTGAIQMFNLKKQGFNLYVAGAGIAILNTILSVATMPTLRGPLGDSMGGIVWVAVIIGVGINVAFIAMYNANKGALVH